MLGFKKFNKTVLSFEEDINENLLNTIDSLNEAFEPSEYRSKSGNIVSHSYVLPSGNHRVDVLYTKIQKPGSENTGSWMVDFKRTSLDSSGKPTSDTFNRRGMSDMDPRDRVHGILAVRHSLKKMVDSDSPYRLSYSANTRKKGEFYKKAFDSHVIGQYNKQNNFDPEHEHAARPGYAGAGMVFPKNEPGLG